MYKISDTLEKLNKVVYSENNKVCALDMLSLTITGVRDMNNDLHMVFVQDIDCDHSKNLYMINKIYETTMTEQCFRESAEAFEMKYDIDFMTLISYVKIVENTKANVDEQIKLAFLLSKILATA